ncbi:MAG: metallophosphoesterase [Thermoguttaceae bacterium]|nr:metallophosphoesterase [Thermoguttaceae bacterium]
MTLTRRHFLQLSAGLCAAGTLPSLCFAEEENLLKIDRLTISIGLEKPFRAFHISDTHLAYADERETERKIALAKSRTGHFKTAEACFAASLAYAKEHNELLLHTGDLIDFVSEKNFEAAAAGFQGRDAFVSAGNHEFSHYLGEAKEDEAYKAQSYDRVQKAYPNDLKFCSRVVNGVNFVAIDDVYYYFLPEHLPRFEAEVKKGLPIVMMCHVPLYTPKLFDRMVNVNHTLGYVTGAPEELIRHYPKHRFEQQRANDFTLEFIDYLKKQPLLKAILCGHLHFPFQERFSETAIQYVAGANFRGEAYEIAFE